MSNAPAFRLENVRIRVDGRLLLDIPSLGIPAGRATALVGPNGAGKTTLLRVLAMVIPPAEGRLELFGRPVPVRERERRTFRRDVTFVAQPPFLFHRSVRGNVAYGLRARGLAEDGRIETALEEVGLAGFATRPAWKLSAGESQRVALARALVIDPPVLLLDEPTASVDRQHVPRVEATILRLRSAGKTIVLATHDLDQAVRLTDSVLSVSDGRVTTAPLVNRIRGRVVRSGDTVRLETGTIVVELAEDPGSEEATIAIAPEEIVVSTSRFRSSARNALEGRITRAAHDPRGLLLTADCGEPIVARITDHSWRELGLQLGEPVWLTFKSSAVHIVDPPPRRRDDR